LNHKKKKKKKKKRKKSCFHNYYMREIRVVVDTFALGYVV